MPRMYHTQHMDGRTVRAKIKRPKARHVALVDDLLDAEQSIRGAMLKNGYCEAKANMGMEGIPKSALAMLLERESPKLARWQTMTTQDYKALVMARLSENCYEGRDGGVMSAKALGSIRELNLFTPDSQIGVIVVNAPGTEEVAKLISGDPETE